MLRYADTPHDLVRLLLQIYGAAMGDLWLSDPGSVSLIAGNVDSWRSKLKNVSLTAPGATQRPAYAADGSNFRGAKAPIFDGVNDSLELVNASTPFYSTTRPGWITVVRYQVAPVLQTNILSALDNPVTVAMPFQYTTAATGVVNSLYSPVSAASVAAVGTGVRFLETFIRSTDNKPVIGVDGTDAAGSAASGLKTCASVYLANDRGGNFAGISLPFVLKLIDAPSPSARVAGMAAVRGYFGF